MKKICMMIPGNPAVADYYYSWIKELKENDSSLDITYATSYILYDKKLGGTQYDLMMQKHYEEVFLSLDHSSKITIFAHSVGGYFALKLLEKYSEKIEKVIVIFPYIGYSSIKSLSYLPILYWIDRILPLTEAVSRFKRFFTIYDKEIHKISNHELTCCLRFGLRQCVYFNKYKFDTHIISKNKDKLYFMYTERDRWCPIETIDLLKPISKYKKLDLPHDFIINKESRLKMIAELKMIQFL